MNEEKLHNIRQTLVKSRSKMNKRLLFTGFFLLLFSISAAFNFKPQKEIPCYISPEQKAVLKSRISSIAATQKVSEYMIFRRLKGALKYETIRKMSCKQYTEALEYLTGIERYVTQ